MWLVGILHVEFYVIATNGDVVLIVVLILLGIKQFSIYFAGIGFGEIHDQVQIYVRIGSVGIGGIAARNGNVFDFKIADT